MKTKAYTKKFYDFYRDGVTQSMIDIWLRCPHQAKLQYVDGWIPKAVDSQAIVFGNICHHVLERAYSGICCPLPGIVKTYIKEYEQELNLESMTAEDAYETEISLAKAEAVMMAYFQHYQKDFDNNWEIAETIFKVPFKFKDGKTSYISGKLDGGFTEKRGLWLMDHKCMGRINIENLLVLLPVDIQINTYLWCVTQLTGNCPRGFKYNIIRNPQTKPHQRKEESLKEYSDRVMDDINDRPKHYFNRINIPIVQVEIDKWFRDWLTPIMRDMRRWHDSNYRWPEYYRPNSFKTEYGTLSPWAYAIAENDFARYEKRQHLFPELVRRDTNENSDS